MIAKELYLETPLYTAVHVDSFEDLLNLINYYYVEPFDGYNPILKQETTFTVMSESWMQRFAGDTNEYLKVRLQCKRSDLAFVYLFHWDGEKGILTKVGQDPSLAEFHTSKAKQYDKIFEKSYLKEYTKAIGLAAHGVGIGSFVYLRRVFEKLIYEAADVKFKIDETGKSDFIKMRMNDKISFLSDFLPNFLVENRELYGILSVGIHELDEKTCLNHFEVVKVGIEFILDEKLENHQREKKMQEAVLKIKSVATSVKK